MRNGFLGSLLVLFLAGSAAPAQSLAKLGPPQTFAAPESPNPGTTVARPGTVTFPEFVAPPDTPWQPPRTDLDDRPNVGPGGYRFYGAVDYILWWTQKDRPVPTLVAGSAAPGSTDYDALTRNGLRGVMGMWLNQQQSVGLELGGFGTLNRAPGNNYQADDLGVHSQLHSQLSSGEFQLRAEAYRGIWAHFDVLAGFRYLSYDEGLDIAQRDFAADVVTSDRVSTRNRFYGGQLGTEMELHSPKCFLNIWGKVALGANDETLNANGTTVEGGSALPGGSAVPAALAGRYYRDQFAVLPEFGCKLGYNLTQHLRMTAGYTFFCLTQSLRPGEQLDALLHTPQPTLLPFQSNDFWVQGLNLGLEFRF